METLTQIHVEKKIPVLVNLHNIEIARRYGNRIIGIQQGTIKFDQPVGALSKSELFTVYNRSGKKDLLPSAGSVYHAENQDAHSSTGVL